MVHRWPWAFRSIWRAVFLASLYIFVILCISLCWLASGWPMGGQQSKCAACCGDKDESGQRVFILLGYETIVSILRFVSSLDVHWSFVVSMVWGGFSVCHPPAVQHSLADFDNLCFNIPDSPFVVFFCVSWLSNDNFALWLYLLTLLRCGRRHSKFEGSCREFLQNSCDMFRSPKSYFTVPRLMHFQYVLTSLGCIPINKCFRTKILLHIGIAYSILYYTPPKVPVTIVQHIQVACFENRLYAFHLMVNHQISSFSLLKSAYSGHIGGVSYPIFEHTQNLCNIFGDKSSIYMPYA